MTRILSGSSWIALVLAVFASGVSVGHASPEISFTAQERSHWALQKVVRPAVPDIRSDWVRNPIDAFVLSRLKSHQINPGEPADKVTWLRRATLDLLGLPPIPEDVDAFLADDSPAAFAKVVDRLVASPHYGERWARHWLDLARYAESEGFKADETRPNAWRYRDYVIKAFNDDKPYDRFLQEQLAGDELWPDDPEARLATAFNRHYPDESNARNLMQRRQEILNDITDTVGSVFVGLTYSCARCHDHKFDPIRQVDYYRLQAFFANTAAADQIALAPDEMVQDYETKLAVWEEKTRDVREQIAAIEEPKRRQMIDEFVEKYPEEIQAALARPASERSPFEAQMAAKAKLYIDPASHQYIGSAKAVAGLLKGDARKRWEELNKELQTYASLHPGKLPIGTGINDLGAQAPKTFLLRRGNWDAPQREVEPGFLSILDPEAARIEPLPSRCSTGRRAALAKILTDPRNPLTARVMVNRIWHYHFGRGIVGTPSDFGTKGDRPTHPELLDWLASEFISSGWSVKAMHRLIMTSSTYRQSTLHRAAAASIDPENKLLWHFPRQRLEAETIRDCALAVAGRLNTEMGGPSVFPELPPGLETRGGWNLSKEMPERDRRSIYVFVRRNTRYPMFETFDMPDTHESCARRNITTSPLQALTLMNSSLMLDWAQSFAGRVLARAGVDLDQQIEFACRVAYARKPAHEERSLLREFMERQEIILRERSGAGEKLALPAPLPEQIDPVRAAALVDLCHTLMNSNEFVYRN
jgi:hypothetical protein